MDSESQLAGYAVRVNGNGDFTNRGIGQWRQGAGYLDDGTMIVVDNARDKIGKTLQVAVSSVLQTQAGKMIFAKLEKDLNKR